MCTLYRLHSISAGAKFLNGPRSRLYLASSRSARGIDYTNSKGQTGDQAGLAGLACSAGLPRSPSIPHTLLIYRECTVVLVFSVLLFFSSYYVRRSGALTDITLAARKRQFFQPKVYYNSILSVCLSQPPRRVLVLVHRWYLRTCVVLCSPKPVTEKAQHASRSRMPDARCPTLSCPVLSDLIWVVWGRSFGSVLHAAASRLNCGYTHRHTILFFPPLPQSRARENRTCF